MTSFTCETELVTEGFRTPSTNGLSDTDTEPINLWTLKNGDCYYSK